MLKIGIVANEVSGDILGAGLIKAIKQQYPDAQFEGVAGPLMLAQGGKSLFDMERLSVMGLVEVLKHLPELMGLRKQLIKHFLDNPPDVFIGIDAPDFNLTLEKKLKQAGIPTVHYVCPTVWAWRPGRVKHIRAAADLVLSVFPFEPAFLQQFQVKAKFVGHTMADDIPLNNPPETARKELGIDQSSQVIAILPGSRMSEIQVLAEPFLQTAKLLKQKYPDMQFVVPLVNDRVANGFESIRQQTAPDLNIITTREGARLAMQAANLVLTASGTATLEAMLVKRPMVVAYKLHSLSYWIINTFNLLNIPYVSMANLLAGERLVPEYIQHEVTPEALQQAVVNLLEHDEKQAELIADFYKIHKQMKCDANKQAAKAVIELCKAST